MERERFKIDIGTPDPGYEPFPVSIMNRSTYEATTFDPSLGNPATISYRLNKAGCIRVRIVHRRRQDLLLRTLQDWTDQDFGKYELKWDGRDASGNIVDNRQIMVCFESKDKEGGLIHKEHDRKICRDPALIVETNTKCMVGVDGMLELQTRISDGRSGFGQSDGVEARYYIDYELFHAERLKAGSGKFDFRIDAGSLKNGEQLITVNISDLHDHIGTAGVRISVKK